MTECKGIWKIKMRETERKKKRERNLVRENAKRKEEREIMREGEK